MLYMAIIFGWDPVVAFADTDEKAEELAIKKKMSFCMDDLNIWDWEHVCEFYGASVGKVENGTAIRL